MIRLVIENKIPFIKGLLDDICDVKYLDPEDITADAMRHADALITRTRTRCDQSLLQHSPCRFIATATIGTDHIDLDYCRNNGITVANAPGCNAPAVAQYTLASIANWLDINNRPVDTVTIGIVGVGNVGSIVNRWAQQLGMKVMLCDPPRADKEGDNTFVTLDEIARHCDIITFHTPHTTSGTYATHHMCDSRFLNLTQHKPLIINCARGPIVDTQALISALDAKIVSDAVIDCWEGEPNISIQLLDRALIATPHIAGYSREGKIRATEMVLSAFTQHFTLSEVHTAETVAPGAAETVTLDSITASYNPLNDTAALKAAPHTFESLRNNYNYRNEVK